MATILKDHFMPGESNGYLPYTLTQGAFLFYVAIGIFLVLSPIYFPISPIASLVNFITPFPSDNVIELVNESRQGLGVTGLKENAVLDEAARSKADDMFARQYFSHISPDGAEPWAFFKENKYDFSAAGENLAIDYTSARDAHTALMGSPTHRANILNPNYEEIGVAVESGVFQGRPSLIIVQFFGRPRPTFFESVFGGGASNSSGGTLTETQLSQGTSATVAGTETAEPHVLTFTELAVAIGKAFTANLSRGSSGSDVEKLQQLLATDPEVYPEKLVTGYYGALTENAVKRFQQRHGVVTSGTPETTGFGVVGPKTRAKITEVFAVVGRDSHSTVLGEAFNARKESRNADVLLSYNKTMKTVASVMIVTLIIPALFVIVRRRRLSWNVILRTTLLISFFIYIGWIATAQNTPMARFQGIPAASTVVEPVR